MPGDNKGSGSHETSTFQQHQELLESLKEVREEDEIASYRKEGNYFIKQARPDNNAFLEHAVDT